jgi:hypothetical protein
MPSSRFGGVISYVGATIDRKASTDDHRVFVFDESPVLVDDLPAYRTALRAGDLLPGDLATAKLVGIPFVPPAEALAAAKARAAALYAAQTGEPAPFLDPPKAAPAAVTGDL